MKITASNSTQSNLDAWTGHKYLNNRIEQSHRCIKRRTKPMLGFKSNTCANIILSGIETIQMMRRGQADYARNVPLNLKQQFEMLIPAK
ncbi:DDE-type integrase/transposase/recombinase [Microvirga sp. W0021]|uniref:DDE-type integrase/transposase/recombinase n=1 Tax=Hohaiivirga grylli TaxID=3133970 RepID=A0ABV0BLC1_9HYPH